LKKVENESNLNINEKIHIGIIECSSHAFLLYLFSRIFLTDNTKVTLFTTHDNWKITSTHIKDISKYNIVIKNKNEELSDFLKRVESFCNKNKVDLLIIQTMKERIRSLLTYKNFNPDSKIILVLQSINAWLDNTNPRWYTKFWKKYYINKNFFLTIWLTFDTIVSSYYINKYILNKIDAYVTSTKPLVQYIKSLGVKKPVFEIPCWFTEAKDLIEGRKNIKKSRILIFIVPGYISKMRRDHKTILNVFEDILKRYNRSVELILLGSPKKEYGKKIIEKAEEMSLNGLNIKYFKKFIPEKEYQLLISKADFLISPIRFETWSNGVIYEIAGKTKGGSAFIEAVLNKKPIIIPKNYNFPPELETSLIEYENEENLKDIIIDLINQPDKVIEYKKEAFKNAEKFTLKKIHDYIEGTVLKQLNIGIKDDKK